jgi:hypothetical protein
MSEIVRPLAAALVIAAATGAACSNLNQYLSQRIAERSRSAAGEQRAAPGYSAARPMPLL